MATAWTREWLKSQSWREVIRMKRLFESLPEPSTAIVRARKRRLIAEYFRRGKEGGGGLAHTGFKGPGL